MRGWLINEESQRISRRWEDLRLGFRELRDAGMFNKFGGSRKTLPHSLVTGSERPDFWILLNFL